MIKIFISVPEFEVFSWRLQFGMQFPKESFARQCLQFGSNDAQCTLRTIFWWSNSSILKEICMHCCDYAVCFSIEVFNTAQKNTTTSYSN